MVLLKNDAHTLPVQAQRIALFGVNAYFNNNDVLTNASFNPKFARTLEQGLTEVGFAFNTSLQGQYIKYAGEQLSVTRQNMQGFASNAIPEMELPDATITAELASSSLAIITIGRATIKGTDRKVENDFNLSEAELNLIKTVSTKAHAQNKKLVIILNIAGVIETASWRNYADAILLTWQPGLLGGKAVADILTGAVNPSGKLAVTFPMAYRELPSAQSFEASTRVDATESIYSDSSYVGYSYYTAFGKTPSYAFGFGLSYTTFSIKNPRVKKLGNKHAVQVTVDVTNTGTKAGKKCCSFTAAQPETTIKCWS
jgi:beta-glucosidase